MDQPPEQQYAVTENDDWWRIWLAKIPMSLGTLEAKSRAGNGEAPWLTNVQYSLKVHDWWTTPGSVQNEILGYNINSLRHQREKKLGLLLIAQSYLDDFGHISMRRSLGSPPAPETPETPDMMPSFNPTEDLPRLLLQDLLVITNEKEIYQQVGGKSRLELSRLINRFIYQILEGCGNEECNTATCLTTQIRCSRTPHRKFTPLTARTIAFMLAGRSDAESKLCHFCPEIPPSPTRPTRSGHSVTFDIPEDNLPQASTGDSAATQATDGGTARFGTSSVTDGEDQNRETAGQTPGDELPIDPDSFTQALFTTDALLGLQRLAIEQTAVAHTFPQQTQNAPNENTQASSSPGPSTRPTPSIQTIPKIRSIPNSLWREFCISQGFVKESLSPSGINIGNEIRDGTIWMSMGLWFHSLYARDMDLLDVEDMLNDLAEIEELSTEIVPPPAEQKAPLTQIESRPVKRVGPEEQSFTAAVREAESLLTSSPLTSSPSSHDVTYTLRKISSGALLILRIFLSDFEETILGISVADMDCEAFAPDWQKHQEYHDRLNRKFPAWAEFVKQIFFYLLKDPTRLAYGFQWDETSIDHKDAQVIPTVIMPIAAARLFTGMFTMLPPETVLHFMSYSLELVQDSTLEVMQPTADQKRRRRGKSTGKKKKVRYPNPFSINNEKAAFACMAVFYALSILTAVPAKMTSNTSDEMIWTAFNAMRAMGGVFPENVIDDFQTQMGNDIRPIFIELADVYGNDVWVDKVRWMAKIIRNRTLYDRCTRREGDERKSVLDLLMDHMAAANLRFEVPGMSTIHVPSAIVEWLKTVIHRDWDGEAVIIRAEGVGAAIELLEVMYENRSRLNLDESLFELDFVAAKIGEMDMPAEWLSYKPDPKSFHIFSCSFFFSESTLARYFRASNLVVMTNAFEKASAHARNVHHFIRGQQDIPIREPMHVLAMSQTASEPFLVLKIRRSHILEDAMDQIWRLEMRQLIRPLKVRMGMNEGEQGLDHGGVQQEFFRCLFAEAFSPAFGMFTVDERTRMIWFQPGSLESLYKFEMLGILFSIAVFNSITLPVTFPLAFYRKLLGLPVTKLEHIEDGWPVLAKGLKDLLEWTEGDVGDVFVRTYEFSYEAFGERKSIDMQKVKPGDDTWPQSNDADPADEDPSSSSASTSTKTPHPITPYPHPAETSKTSEAALVTNKTRKAYVSDYINFLTSTSISPQFTAFQRGFNHILPRPSLSLLPPRTLRSITEGSQTLDITAWESATRYEDGYHAQHLTIRQFWSLVATYTPAQLSTLLEYVTASDRVPVTGWESVDFVIQRSGDDDNWLPTSMTCFGRLLLPQYSGQGVMAERLGKALENSRGFGVV